MLFKSHSIIVFTFIIRDYWCLEELLFIEKDDLTPLEKKAMEALNKYGSQVCRVVRPVIGKEGNNVWELLSSMEVSS